MKVSPSQLGDVFRILTEVLLQHNLDPDAELPAPAPGARKPTSAGRVKQVLNELYVACEPISDGKRAVIDKRLQKLGLPQLSVLENIWTQQHVRILKRKAIRNEEEFQYAEGLLDDQLSDISDEDSKALVELMNEYAKKRQSS